MADRTDPLPFYSPSPSPSPPSSPVSGCKIGNLNGNGCQEFQDTVPFGDTMVIDSPSVGTHGEKLCFDTEVVDDQGSDEETRLECEEEVVLDSEDEGLCQPKAASFVGVETYRRCKRKTVDMQNRKLSLHCEQTKCLAADPISSIDQQCIAVAGKKGSSIDFESFGGKKDLPQLSTSDRLPGRFYCISSQQSRESSQALEFVDNFIKLNNMNVSQGVEPRKIVTGKSHSISSARGAQNLTKIIKERTLVRETGTFEWVENHQHEEIDFSSERIKSSSRFGDDSVEKTATSHLNSKGPGILANEHEKIKMLTDLHIDPSCTRRNLLNGSIRECDEHSQTDLSGSGQELGATGIGRDMEDMPDIGIGTQIAVEAIEALAYAAPDHFQVGREYHAPENTTEDSPKGMMDGEALLKQHSFLISTFTEIGGNARQPIRRKRSARKFNKKVPSLFQKHYKNQKLDPELETTTKAKGRQTKVDETVASKNGKRCVSYKSPIRNEKICCVSKGPSKGGPATAHKVEQWMNVTEGDLLTYRRKRKGAAADSSRKHSEVPLNASAEATDSKLAEQGEPDTVHKTEQWMAGYIMKGSKDQLENPGEKTQNVTDDSRRKGVAADSRRKHSELHLNGCSEAINTKLSEQKQTGRQLAAITSFLKLEEWNYPKGKRTSHKVQSHFSGASAICALFTTIDGKENIHNVRCCKLSENCKETSRKKLKHAAHLQPSLEHRKGLSRQSFKEEASGVVSNCRSAVSNDGMLPVDLDRPSASAEFGKLFKMDAQSLSGAVNHGIEVSLDKSVEPSGSKRTIPVSSTKSVNEVSSDNMQYVYRRKPSNRNLPKSSLLKELVKLSIPERIPDFTWKDLRRRRDSTCIRVLFSQHLDDDTIKQQKKISARLGISITSNSMDATHYIADRFVRTRNMLEAIAAGKPVVTPLWLENSAQASWILDEKNYILRDSKKEKEIGFSMPGSLARASQFPLLKDKRVCITPNVKPNKEMITSLVKAVQGKTIEGSQIFAVKDLIIPDDLLILSSELDEAICTPLLEKGAAVHSSDLLLNGIVLQKLEYKRHRIFTSFRANQKFKR
ncbi:hypothetical protein SLE2022_244180 [Rubroshorea leprosula]